MPPRTRKTPAEKAAPATAEDTAAAAAEGTATVDTAAAEETAPTEQADPAPPEDTAPAGPMVCIVGWCDEPEAVAGLGVCREHFDAGWRFVKEPDGD
ncbi:hypothetical protein [Amycolatopsis sp. YIM 10]|uniref:hypothetical protein n=1 Tax=Amycolatopsis sp. YIM 10 TaxID=2653857 RepID=UPI0012904F33|nr:hypothetical protein [Amycolatopsis sp. YIM 10]QFU87873.1 hypothetical protein YIM_13435 [Amycolatopsis sp. YIM 10]QFU94814.1 hypothetical protein YIM_48445 [Amycolatopsis sp. YIM 10]